MVLPLILAGGVVLSGLIALPIGYKCIYVPMNDNNEKNSKIQEYTQLNQQSNDMDFKNEKEDKEYDYFEINEKVDSRTEIIGNNEKLDELDIEKFLKEADETQNEVELQVPNTSSIF
jgi:hypothetical protein